MLQLIKSAILHYCIFVVWHSYLSAEDTSNVHYMFTVVSKAETLPELSAVGVCDDRQIKIYNNEERCWVQTEQGFTNTPEPPKPPESYLDLIKTLSNCTDSQCPEAHVLQRIIGCELEKFPNGSVKILTAFDKYGFDGEDFLSFHSDTKKWTEKNPKAAETKLKWDLNTGRNQLINYYLQSCMSWISTYNNTRKSKPEVQFNVRKASGDQHRQVLICLANNFHPKDVEMKIRLDRKILEHQNSSGVRPNPDGSFQMRNRVKFDRNSEGIYDCHVSHSSLTEPLTVLLDNKCLDCEQSMTPVTMLVIAAALLGPVFAVIVIFIFKRICQRVRGNSDRENHMTEMDNDFQTREARVLLQ